MSDVDEPWKASVCVDRAVGDGWAWVDLPLSDEELESFLRGKAGLDAKLDDEGRLPAGIEPRVSDFDKTGLLRDLGFTDIEGESLTDLNLMCQTFRHQIESEGEWVTQAVGALVELDHPQGRPSAYEIANYAMQLDEIPFHSYGLDEETTRNCDSPEELYGMCVLDNPDMTKAMEEPLGNSKLTLGMYVDVEKLGRDCAMNDNVELYDEGYYEKNEEATADPSYYSRSALRDMIADDWPDTPAMRSFHEGLGQREPTLPEYWGEQIAPEDAPLARDVIAHDGTLLDFDCMKGIERVLGSCDWDFYHYANGEYGDDLLELTERPVEAKQILEDLHDRYLDAQGSTACDPADPLSLDSGTDTCVIR